VFVGRVVLVAWGACLRVCHVADVPGLVVGDWEEAPGVVVRAGAGIVSAANDLGCGGASISAAATRVCVVRTLGLFVLAAAETVLAAAGTVLAAASCVEATAVTATLVVVEAAPSPGPTFVCLLLVVFIGG
jgi:hypothetical protein